MSRRVRFLCWITVFLLCAQLVGCGTGEDDAGKGTTGSSQSTTESTTVSTTSGASATEPPQEIISIPYECITVADLADMQIVYPAASENDTALLECINSHIRQELENKYGVRIPVVTDDRTRYPERTYEILIGNTNREEHADLEPLLIREYGYWQRGNKILINGGNSLTLKTAVIRFSNDIIYIKRGGVDYFYRRTLDYLYDVEFIAEHAQLNGVPFGEYAVVYPQNATLYEKQLAVRLADRITFLCGRQLAVYSDATPYVSDAREILVGRTNRPFSIVTANGAAIESGGSFVALVGATAYEYGTAEKGFEELIDVHMMIGHKNVVLSTQRAVVPSDKVSMMGYNIEGSPWLSYQIRIDNICRQITKYLPDIVAFQEPAADFMDLTYVNLDQYYGYFLGDPRHGDPPVSNHGANSYGPILYAKDRYEFVEGDTKWMTATPDEISKLDGSDYYRIYTYAVLRDLQTGEEFLVVNIHLDFSPDVQVKTLQYMFRQLQNDGYNDLPVFLVGDMNANEKSAAMQLIMESAGFISAEELAGDPVATAGSMIDWILASPIGVTGVEYTVSRETYEDPRKQSYLPVMPSDHPAIYAEFYISAPSDGMLLDWSAVFRSA